MEMEVPRLNIGASILLLIVATVLVAFRAEFLVESMDGMTDYLGISREWISLILLPNAVNCAEHITAVTFLVRHKLEVSVKTVFGSSIVRY